MQITKPFRLAKDKTNTIGSGYLVTITYQCGCSATYSLPIDYCTASRKTISTWGKYQLGRDARQQCRQCASVTKTVQRHERDTNRAEYRKELRRERKRQNGTEPDYIPSVSEVVARELNSQRPYRPPRYIRELTLPLPFGTSPATL